MVLEDELACKYLLLIVLPIRLWDEIGFGFK